MRRRFLLIVNAGAGVSGSPLVEAAVQALEQEGACVTRMSAASFDAVRRAAHDAAHSGDYDAIIAAGGDGTIRHVAAAIIGTGVPLGVIPVGTANVLAQEIGLVPKPSAVARMLLAGPVVKVSCAHANGEPFLLMVGAGFDARVVAALDHRIKSRIGKAAYAGPVLGALVRPIDTLSVAIDGHRHEASWAVICNARHYGGRFVMAPRTGIQKRGLEAILFKAKSRAELASQLMCLALGKLDARAAERSDVVMLPCSRVSIGAHHPVPTQIDGDVLGTTPLEIEADCAEVQMIVPENSAGIGN